MAQSGITLRRWLAGAAAAATLALSGCADGVELNGKLFDMLGVSPAAQTARTREPRLADRAPLVMPPDATRLPEPGSGQAATDLALDDQDQRKAREAKERARLHQAYCRGDIQWKERVLNRDDSAPRSPYGPCSGIFNITNNVNKP